MLDFIANIAFVIIIIVSQSYQVDIVLSLLILFPIWVIKIIYSRNKNKKMGKQLFKISKTFSEEHNIRNTLVVSLFGAVFIGVFTYFLSSNHRIGIPWLILLVVNFIDKIYLENILQKALLENGICTGSRLIEWNSVQSYKWVNPRKKKDFIYLKIGYSEFFSYHMTYLSVLDDQKEEVDELFKKMVSI